MSFNPVGIKFHGASSYSSGNPDSWPLEGDVGGSRVRADQI